jgi:hypothetical protein
MTMTAIGFAVVLGALVCVPLGLRLVEAGSATAERLLLIARLGALPAGIMVTVSLALPVGLLAVGLAVPWAVVGLLAVATAATREIDLGFSLRPDSRHAESAALLFLAVAPVFLLADRLGIQPLGIDPVIVRLTSVHFTFTGFVLPLVGAFVWRRRPSRWLELAVGAVALGIPVTALGFLGPRALNWAGAIAVAGGGFGIALALLGAAGRLEDAAARVLMRTAGTALLIAMPLAVVYATGRFTGNAWIDLPTMARIHGMLNALGFALPALIGMMIAVEQPTRAVGRTAEATQ